MQLIAPQNGLINETLDIMKSSARLLLLSAFTFLFIFANAQEYDDLYFSKKDRKALKPIAAEKELPIYDSEELQAYKGHEDESKSSFLGRQYQFDEYQEEPFEVSQESIDKYKRANIDQPQGDFVENPNYSSPVETYENEPTVVNNYYNVDPWAAQFNSNWGFGAGWNNWGNNFIVSFGRRPFRNAWFGNAWFSPFYNPFDPWGNQFFGWGGFNSPWGGFYDPFWCPPFGNAFAGGFYGNRFNRGFYGNRVVVVGNGERNGRQVVRGARNTRGGSVSSSGRSARVTNSAISNDSRDFSRTQSRYLDQSRRTVRTTNSGNVSSGDRSRSSNSSVNRSSTRQRTSSPTYNRTSGSSRSSSGSVRSSGSSRSSSGRSSSGSVRSSGSSRSSSGSVRSSGSSRSSSGRSSSGRSSSGRSSSSRSRGN